MAYHVTTALGREVPLGDWQEVHRDTILKVLYDSLRMSPLGAGNRPVGLTRLCTATGLAPADVQAVCDVLAQDGLIEAVGPGGYHITGRGVVVVRDTRSAFALSGSLE